MIRADVEDGNLRPNLVPVPEAFGPAEEAQVKRLICVTGFGPYSGFLCLPRQFPSAPRPAKPALCCVEYLAPSVVALGLPLPIRNHLYLYAASRWHLGAFGMKASDRSSPATTPRRAILANAVSCAGQHAIHVIRRMAHAIGSAGELIVRARLLVRGWMAGISARRVHAPP
jgi:hypothetical protein